jgi:hypothetical protein
LLKTLSLNFSILVLKDSNSDEIKLKIDSTDSSMLDVLKSLIKDLRLSRSDTIIPP